LLRTVRPCPDRAVGTVVIGNAQSSFHPDRTLVDERREKAEPDEQAMPEARVLGNQSIVVERPD